MRCFVVVAAAAAAFAGTAWAGDVCTWDRCHRVCFSKPREQVKAYEERQHDRFEPVDPVVLEHLRQTVLVSVVLPGEADFSLMMECHGLGAPQRIVLASSGTAVLTVPLKAVEVTLQNATGARVAAHEGTGEIPAADVRKLGDNDGQGYDLHLILENEVRKGHFDNDWSEQLLK